jgi:hypothetical protein
MDRTQSAIARRPIWGSCVIEEAFLVPLTKHGAMLAAARKLTWQFLANSGPFRPPLQEAFADPYSSGAPIPDWLPITSVPSRLDCYAMTRLPNHLAREASTATRAVAGVMGYLSQTGTGTTRQVATPVAGKTRPGGNSKSMVTSGRQRCVPATKASSTRSAFPIPGSPPV